ncbi:hypothetical protein GCM10018952_10870 [Streptosporangium vulgare]
MDRLDPLDPLDPLDRTEDRTGPAGTGLAGPPGAAGPAGPAGPRGPEGPQDLRTVAVVEPPSPTGCTTASPLVVLQPCVRRHSCHIPIVPVTPVDLSGPLCLSGPVSASAFSTCQEAWMRVARGEARAFRDPHGTGRAPLRYGTTLGIRTASDRTVTKPDDGGP